MELLRARTNEIEMPDLVWIGPEVIPPEQDGHEDKAIGKDQEQLVWLNSVEEAVQTRSLPST